MKKKGPTQTGRRSMMKLSPVMKSRRVEIWYCYCYCYYFTPSRAHHTHTHTQRTASSARCSPNRYLHHSRVQYTARAGDIVKTHATSHDLSRRSPPSPAPLPTPHMLPTTPSTPTARGDRYEAPYTAPGALVPLLPHGLTEVTPDRDPLVELRLQELLEPYVLSLQLVPLLAYDALRPLMRLNHPLRVHHARPHVGHVCRD